MFCYNIYQVKIEVERMNKSKNKNDCLLIEVLILSRI